MARAKKYPALQRGAWALIPWDDACAHNGQAWSEVSDISAETRGIAHCITVGRVVLRDAKQVVLAQSSGPEEIEKAQAGNTWALPLGMITRVQLINPEK